MSSASTIASEPPAATTPTPSVRLTSLDQFRGYTMLGMLLVNFIGGYTVTPQILRHSNDYCSYADTIMPQFFFAAGFAMRLSLGKRLQTSGKMPWGRAIRRFFALALVAIGWYSFEGWHKVSNDFSNYVWDDALYFLFKDLWFQTLLHIAVTSLWILPVIATSWQVRFGYAVFSAVLHLVLSWWFNFEWVNGNPGGIDGGPLGFLSWSICAIAGTIACDAVRTWGTGATLRITLSGIALMALGWAMSIPTTLYDVKPGEELPTVTAESPEIETAPEQKKRRHTVKSVPHRLAPDGVIPSMERIRSWNGKLVEPPFIRPPKHEERRWNYWMMSQRGGTLSYLTFSAGLSLVIYALFLWACDTMGWRLGIFRTLGTNSLAAYILADVASNIFGYFVKQYHWTFLTPKYGATPDVSYGAAVLGAIAAYVIFAGMVYAACRLLEKMGWYLRV